MVNPLIFLLMIESQLGSAARMNYVTWDSSCSSLYAPLLTISPHIRLDSIGIGGFSHDFGSLSGKTSPVAAAIDSMTSVEPSFSTMLTFVLGTIIPGLSMKIPNKHMRAMGWLARETREIASELLDKAARETAEVGVGEVDKSIFGGLGEPCFLL